MAEPRSVLVLTSCTSLKATVPGGAPVAAEDLYLGEQHRRLMRGISAFRSAATGFELDLRIVSAGYGLVAGDRPLEHYDSTFAGLGRAEIERRGRSLGLPEDVRGLLARPFSLALVLLGNDYSRAAALGPGLDLGGPVLAFAGAAAARGFAGEKSVRVVAAGKAEARRFHCGLVGLKGELAGRLLELLASRPQLVDRIADPGHDLLDLIDEGASRPLRLAA